MSTCWTTAASSLIAALENAKEDCEIEYKINNRLDALDVRTYTKPRFESVRFGRYVRQISTDMHRSTKSTMRRVNVRNEISRQAFHVHEELVAQHSNFFAAALTKDWKEVQKNIVTLPDEDAVLFEIFTNFV